MRRFMLMLIVTLAAVTVQAESAVEPQSVISQVARDVEGDLAGHSGLAPGASQAALAFDPLQRARGNLAAWTTMPARVEPPRPLPVSGGSPSTVPGAHGMTREYFNRLGTSLTFPANAETARAIRRMAKGHVSAIPNRCAGTMREALGWGLGDAHDWTALPSRGYTRRPTGTVAQPGDIVVWPFTYGSRNSQHIGIAVQTDAGMRLLSNLSGSLGLSRILPGYRAYWK